jgi:hypothetical protein
MHGYLLGTYRFKAGQGRVRIGTEGVDGYVYAKAVVLTRKKLYVLDNDAPEVQIAGRWTVDALTPGHYGADVLVSAGSDGDDGAVTYPFAPIEPGQYDALVWLPDLREDAAPSFLVDVHHKGRQDTVTVDTNEASVGWLHVGQFDFAAGEGQFVRIRRGSTGGIVYADAVKLFRTAEEATDG